MLNRLFVVDSVTLTSTGTAVSSYTPWDQTTRKLPTQVVVKATGQGAYVRLSNDNSAATNADVLVQGGDHVVLSVQGRRWVSVLSDGASSTVNVGALSTGVSGSAASLDLAFVDAGVLDPRVTFTRASTATYFNSAGVLTSAAINESRRDFDPATLAVRGLLIEEQRTNSIRNNTMQGAVAGTPGTLPTNWGGTGTPVNGLTRQVVGTGTESGITYIDIRYSGTTTSTSFHALNEEPIGAIAALSGQTWTHTVYISVVGGSMANINAFDVGINEYSSVPAYLVGSSVSITPSAGALVGKRFALVRTLTNASTASIHPFILFTYNSGVAIDITLRIGLPQLEQGAFATSVIPTTTMALTRSADVASVNTLSPWYNASAGTIFCQGLTPPGLANFPAIGPALSDGTTSNRMIQYVFTNGFYGAATTSGASQGNTSITTTPTIGAQYKFATAYSNNDSQSALNGTASTVDNTYTVPTVNQMQINTGGAASVNLPNSWIQRITYYPRRLSQAELTAITA